MRLAQLVIIGAGAKKMNVLREGTPDEAGFLDSGIERLRERAEEFIHPERARSFVLLVARRGIVVLYDAWGPLTAAPDSPPMERDSIFRMASLTKPVTATAVMQLVDEGRVSLTRPFVEYMPEAGGGKHVDEVLVHHLLTHTSGFQWDDESAFFAECMAAMTEPPPPCPETSHEQIHAVTTAIRSHGVECVRPPGQEMAYSDLYNYGLLAEIVRRVSGQSFWDFTRERIFEPLGMVDSSMRWGERFTDRLVMPGVELDPGVDVPSGGAGLKSTVWDMATFGQMFLNGGSYRDERILSRRAIEEMTRNQIPGIGADFLGWHPEASWGYGWGIQGNERWRMFHGGLTPLGTFSHGGYGGKMLLVDPSNEVVAAYFSVCLDIDEETGEHHWEADRFQDLVFSALI